MHYEDIRSIDGTYEHIYLSPHLDDAVLSCGGAIAWHNTQGARALVVTLCAAAPPAAGPFSDLAHDIHAEWGLSPAEVVAARRREDELALSQIGVDSLYAGMLDAIYRHPVRYNSRDALFGTPDPADPMRAPLVQYIAELRRRWPGATLYAPLGVGKHVDHQLCYQATLAAAEQGVAFYEDIPYVLKPNALQQRLDELQAVFVPSVVAIDDMLVRKVRAVAAYESQIGVLFGGTAAMEQQISEYAEDLRPELGTYGERLWLKV